MTPSGAAWLSSRGGRSKERRRGREEEGGKESVPPSVKLCKAGR